MPCNNEASVISALALRICAARGRGGSVSAALGHRRPHCAPEHAWGIRMGLSESVSASPMSRWLAPASYGQNQLQVLSDSPAKHQEFAVLAGVERIGRRCAGPPAKSVGLIVVTGAMSVSRTY